MTTYKGKLVTVKGDPFTEMLTATVDFPDSGYGNTGDLNIERHLPSIRMAARRAILERLREELGADALADKESLHLEIVAQGIHGNNVWHSITFREKVVQNW
jgi:hypothetical protein